MTRVNFGEPSWIARFLRFERDGDVLAAAGATVEPNKHPQSLNLYFVRGGEYDVDVELNVTRTRDGRSFDTRQVAAVQRTRSRTIP